MNSCRGDGVAAASLGTGRGWGTVSETYAATQTVRSRLSRFGFKSCLRLLSHQGESLILAIVSIFCLFDCL